MKKSFLILILPLVLLTSCRFFDSLFEVKGPRIDFTNVDEYPFFPTCDSLATIAYNKDCFEKTVVKYLQKDLSSYQITVPKSLKEAVIIHIEVNKNGETSLYELEASDKVKEYIPDLEHIISESLGNFPILKPAKKHGNYVTSRYMIPLYIE